MSRQLRYLLLSVSCFYFLPAPAQNYAEDMAKITGKYKNGDVSFHVRYLFYPFDSLRKATDSMNVSCRISGSNYYYKVTSGTSSYEYFKNSKYFFIIDHVEDAIAVKKSTDASQQLWDMGKMDSVIHSPGVRVTYKSLNKDETEYVILRDSTVWNRIKIVFDRNTYTVKEVFMYSDQKGNMDGEPYNKPTIGIYYSDFTNKPFNKDIFDGSRYFSDTPNSIVLNAAYKKYKLLDYVHVSSNRG